jgi:hypothetical protein
VWMQGVTFLGRLVSRAWIHFRLALSVASYVVVIQGY